MKNRSINLLTSLFFLGVLFLTSGCKDVFEEDITNKQIEVNSPLDGAQNSIYKQLFWWNKLEGASQYSIQIASPSFDSLQSIVTDTIVVGLDKFYKTLAPGKYQWRIRGENGAYKTNYQTYNLTMLVAELDQQEVNLVSPANNTFSGATSSGVINFTWEELPGATKYEINIDTITGNFGSSIVLTDETTSENYTYTLPEGDYKWRVKAMDDGGLETDWSDIYYTGYYATAPQIPTLSSPANNTNVSTSTVSFSWNAVTRAKIYTLHIYKNSADTNGVGTYTYPITAPTTNKTVTITGAAAGEEMYWRVSASDKANNTSARSYRRIINMP